jgi:hypothetical protein
LLEEDKKDNVSRTTAGTSETVQEVIQEQQEPQEQEPQETSNHPAGRTDKKTPPEDLLLVVVQPTQELSIHVAQGVDVSEPAVDEIEVVSSTKRNDAEIVDTPPAAAGFAKEDDILKQPPGAKPSIALDSPTTTTTTTSSTGRTTEAQGKGGGGATQSIPQDHVLGPPTYDSEDQIQNVQMYSLSELDLHEEEETDGSSTDLLLLHYNHVDGRIRSSFLATARKVGSHQQQERMGGIDPYNLGGGESSSIFDPEYYYAIAKYEIDNDAWMFEAEDATTCMSISIVLAIAVLLVYLFVMATKRVSIHTTTERREGSLNQGKIA